MLTLALVLAAQATTKEAMKPLNTLVGEWRVVVGASAGEGWEETQAWEYRIEKGDYALQFSVKEGKRFKGGVLSYDLGKKLYRLQATRADGTAATFEGKLDGKELTLDEAGTGPAERLTFTLLRENRFIGAVDRRAAGQSTYDRSHDYQFTRAGTSIVTRQAPVCVVTGGTGTIEVQHAGKTYMVCCNSCRKEFVADPAKAAKVLGWRAAITDLTETVADAWRWQKGRNV